jgi:hypothetical protein
LSEADAVQVHQERDHGGGGEDVVADGGGGHGVSVLCSRFSVRDLLCGECLGWGGGWQGICGGDGFEF